ncbi:hypothetical protein [Pedobacter nototheniae]|uniref:hypothetical protein n=1 Tax=Pedobacter nototheniae TaxID=2488994 RepID=UPI00103A495D|nr:MULTISPECIES: hypothetical protein [Pedobacter]
MTKKENFIANIILIVNGLIINTITVSLVINVLKILKQDHNTEDLFRNLFLLTALLMFFLKYMVLKINGSEELIKLLKSIKIIIWPASIFFVLLSILQIGFLFDFYKEPVPSLIYVISILSVPFFLFSIIFLKKLLKKQLTKEELLLKEKENYAF